MSAAPNLESSIGTTDLDPCCVATDPLCALVRKFVEDWLKTRRSRKGQRGYQEGDVDPIGPYAWLALDSGLPEDAIRKLRTPARYPLTELRVADAIINSIGEPSMFYALEVMPNPLVPVGASAECCGGSEINHRPPVSVTERSIVRAVRVTVVATIPASLFDRLHAFAMRDSAFG